MLISIIKYGSYSNGIDNQTLLHCIYLIIILYINVSLNTVIYIIYSIMSLLNVLIVVQNKFACSIILCNLHNILLPQHSKPLLSLLCHCEPYQTYHGSVMTAELPVVLPDLCPLSPPCLICHGKGSGMHYGVNTCNACKV